MATTADRIMGARGDDVATIGPSAALAEVAEVLHTRRIGAVVVVADDGRVEGIVSERDVVRLLAVDGPDCLDVTVADAMTTDMPTCAASTTSDELMRTMTERRFRHIPIVDDRGHLLGIVSIGDVVKSTIERLQAEKDSLTEYVSGSY